MPDRRGFWRSLLVIAGATITIVVLSFISLLITSDGLTYEQASSLLRDLQRPATGRRAVNESAL